MKWSPHAGSHFSQTFHGIARFDCQMVDLHTFLIYHLLIQLWWICLPAMTSGWYFKDTLRNYTKSFLISKLCFLWLVYTVTPSDSTDHYLTSSNLPFTTKITKKFPAERKTTENLHVMTGQQQTSSAASHNIDSCFFCLTQMKLRHS